MRIARLLAPLALSIPVVFLLWRVVDTGHTSSPGSAHASGPRYVAMTGSDGDRRPFGVAPHLGADEYTGPPPVRTYLPGVFR